MIIIVVSGSYKYGFLLLFNIGSGSYDDHDYYECTVVTIQSLLLLLLLLL